MLSVLVYLIVLNLIINGLSSKQGIGFGIGMEVEGSFKPYYKWTIF